VSAFADEARREAADVLDERRFTGSDAPRPLERPLERLGDALEDAYDWLVDAVPGGSWTLWAIVALGVLALGAVVASATTRRAARTEAAHQRERAEPHDDPATLLRAAAEAERAGDLATAIRLRFRAGLLDLDARGALDLRPAMPTREISRRLRSPTFDGLAGTFEEVVYGGRPAAPDEVEQARQGWPRVRREAADTREPAGAGRS
jgi:hypothetical protein